MLADMGWYRQRDFHVKHSASDYIFGLLFGRFGRCDSQPNMRLISKLYALGICNLRSNHLEPFGQAWREKERTSHIFIAAAVPTILYPEDQITTFHMCPRGVVQWTINDLGMRWFLVDVFSLSAFNRPGLYHTGHTFESIHNALWLAELELDDT